MSDGRAGWKGSMHTLHGRTLRNGVVRRRTLSQRGREGERGIMPCRSAGATRRLGVGEAFVLVVFTAIPRHSFAHGTLGSSLYTHSGFAAAILRFLNSESTSFLRLAFWLLTTALTTSRVPLPHVRIYVAQGGHQLGADDGHAGAAGKVRY